MAGLTSKDLVRALFQLKDLPRPPFIPLVCTFAARLEQIEVQDMLSDPALMSTALSNAQKLFNYDAICNVFDPTLEAEALGCEIGWGGEGDPPEVVSHPLAGGEKPEALDITGLEKSRRIPAVLEATRRLKVVMGKEVAIVGVVTGPATLAVHLKGKGLLPDLVAHPDEAGRIIALAGNVCLSLSRKYCELGVDAIAVADEVLGQMRPQDYALLAGPLKSMWNVLRFYNVNSLLVSRGCTGQQIQPMLGLGADGVVISGDFDAELMKEAALKEKRCYAGTIPVSALDGAPEQAGRDAKVRLREKGRGFFLSTEWEVPYATNVEAMHATMSVVRDLS